MRSNLTIFAIICLLGVSMAAYVQPTQVNTRPIIGIYTQPSEYEPYSPENYSYIAASYVKYIESAGAQAVPIPYDASIEYLDTLFSKINGILFPGGSVDFDGSEEYEQIFLSNAQYLVKKAKAATDAGDFFPIWGTCMGFQLLTFIESGSSNVLVGGYSDQTNQILRSVDTSSRLFSPMPLNLLNQAETVPSVNYSHNFGVLPSTYLNNKVLASNLKVTSLGQNSAGKVFTASFESYNYPIFGVQFHPEKNLFEWKKNAPHDAGAVELSQYFLNFFGNLTRSNTHSFNGTDDENAYLIYQYPVYQIPNSSFTQLYIIPNFKPEPTTKPSGGIEHSTDPNAPKKTIIESLLFN